MTFGGLPPLPLGLAILSQLRNQLFKLSNTDLEVRCPLGEMIDSPVQPVELAIQMFPGVNIGGSNDSTSHATTPQRSPLYTRAERL